MQISAMNFFSSQKLKERLPFLNWLPKYNRDWLAHDFIAGLTVGLTAIPQGIAYAVVAGLEPQYGLYSAFVGCFIYILFGSTPDITIGPTAIMALMCQKYVESHGAAFATLMSFLSGCGILFLGILHLGFLVEFISMPVTIGFTSAAAITIGSSQIKNLLGIKGKTHGVIDSWTIVYENFDKIKVGDAILGISTIFVLFFAKWCKDNTTLSRSKLVDLIILARNAVVVILGTVLAYVFFVKGDTPFTLTGTVNGGLPNFKPPPFSVVDAHNETLTFWDMTEIMGSALIAIPAISILETIAIAKAFAKGKKVDATQEMIALGICNIAGSFFSSMPTAGSFTRTAVNHASGVMTPFGGFFTGTLVLLALGLLTQTFYFIPKTTLAAVIMTAMFYMLEYHTVRMLWRTKKMDLIPLFTTFVFSLLLGLEFGIIVGILVNILILLYSTARPSLTLSWIPIDGQEVFLVTPTQSLVYPAVEYIRDTIVSSCKDKTTSPVVIDGTHIYYIDSTMAKGLKLLIDDLTMRKQNIYLWRWQKSAIETCLGFHVGMGVHFKFDNTLESVIKGSNALKSGEQEIIDNLIDNSKYDNITVQL